MTSPSIFSACATWGIPVKTWHTFGLDTSKNNTFYQYPHSTYNRRFALNYRRSNFSNTPDDLTRFILSYIEKWTFNYPRKLVLKIEFWELFFGCS